MTYEEAKTRINNAITSDRNWPTSVSLSDKYEDQYGIYFLCDEWFIMNNGVDIKLQDLFNKDISLIETIILELESGQEIISLKENSSQENVETYIQQLYNKLHKS